jgi:L-lactate dehydrogenase complex protein LldE
MTNSPTTLPGTGKTVALFATCANDLMFPGTPRATVEVLERLGCRVEFPQEQTCCGQIFTNTGYYREAVPSVRTFVDAFSSYDYVVGPSGSCVGAVRHQHPMLADDAKDAGLTRDVTAVVDRTYDISEFLVNVLGLTVVGAYFPHRVTYHPTCHSMRIAKVGDAPSRLLRAVKGITVVDLPDADQCCGFGGTFSLKNPDVSKAMANDKARNVMSTGAEYLVTGDNLCLLNISGVIHRNRGGIQPIHLVEILAQTEGGLAA